MAHQLDDDDAVVAVGGAVQAIDSLGRNPECRVEADARLGHRHVIVDGLGQGDDGEALLGEAEGVLLRAVSADADDGVQSVLLAVREDHVAHVANPSLDLHAVGLDAARAENRPADGENAGERVFVQRKRTILDQPQKAVADAHGLDAAAEHRLSHAANRRVQSGAIAARGQDADPFDLLHAARSSRLRLPATIRARAAPRNRSPRRIGRPSNGFRSVMIPSGRQRKAPALMKERGEAFEDFLRDLRYGGRALRRAPGFAIVATLTLALGIGATTAMFSVVNGILLRPLPYPAQDRLIELVHAAPGLASGDLFASPAIYFAYRDHSATFESVGLWDWDNSPVTVTGSGEPETVESVEITHEVLTILGADPMVGRGFTEADDLPGSAPTAIISHGYWQRHFGGVQSLGRTLVVDGIPRQVIGVLPQSFRFFDYPADIFYPLQPVRSTAVFPSFDGRGIARLKEGVTLREANEDVARMIPILNQEFAPSGASFEHVQFGPRLRWLKDTVVGDLGDTLWILMATIGVLLLIACANVANLVLVRTQTRRPELAIRAALGAGWARIARVVVAESAILGLAGGALGLALAYVSLPLLLSVAAADLPQVMTVTIDRTVLLAALGTSVVATTLFAVIPAFSIGLSARHLSGALHSGGRSVTEGKESNRPRHLLLVSQVALALVLLIGAGLMFRTFQTLRQVDPGFRDPGNVLTFQLTIPSRDVPDVGPDAVPSSEQSVRMKQAIVDRLAAVPGVESAGFSGFNDGLPFDGDGRTNSFFVEGRAAFDAAGSPKEVQFVSPQFFETLRTPLIAGRTFDWNDVYRDRGTVLVSENLARAAWGSAGAALSKRIGPGRAGPWFEVVGVVKDVHHNGLNQPAPETVVFPVVASDTASFVVRSARVGTTGFLADVRAAVWSINGNLSLANVQTMGDLHQRSMARTSMTLLLLAITGTMALLLGVIGIYGVVSYGVSQRRREIAIRLALGAEPGEVRRMFVRHALVLVGIGVAIGLVAAGGLTRLMTSQLFGVSPLDPLTLLAVALVLVAAAALASYLSAYRVSAFDPIEVLKGE
jgi:predicted permease